MELRALLQLNKPLVLLTNKIYLTSLSLLANLVSIVHCW